MRQGLENKRIPTSPIIQTHILLNMIPIHRTMRIKRYMPLSLFGQPRPDHVLVHLSSQLKRIDKKRWSSFDMSKCDHIFDELLRLGHLKITHVIPPLEKLKWHAYCKFHNSSSHATNDCNVFRWQVQSAINEGRLAFSEMKIDKAPFPVHNIDLDNAKVLIWPDQAKKQKERTWSLVIRGW